MKKRASKGKNYVLAFLVIIGIILVFTGIDYFTHTLSEDYAVPSYYFRNKIIFGTIIGFIAYLFIKNQAPMKKALIFSATISILLQLRYYFSGYYTLKFVLLFLVIHFVILLPLSWLAFKYIKRI